MKAVWKNTVIADSDATLVVEGNHYFPPDSVVNSHIVPSNTHTSCSWKGTASYYDIVVGDDTNSDAAWYYPAPKQAAANIAGYVAFWRGVTVSD